MTSCVNDHNTNEKLENMSSFSSSSSSSSISPLNIEKCREFIFNHTLEEQAWYERSSKSKRKNKKYEHLYRNYVNTYLSTILNMLSHVINTKFVNGKVESSTQWQDLQSRLNISTNEGVLVSFDTSIERNAYTLNFLVKRSEYIMYLFAYAEKGIPLLRQNFIGKKNIAIASFGGGPGFSIVGFYGYLLFDLQFRKKNIIWYIFDFEENWIEQVELVTSTLEMFTKELDPNGQSKLPQIIIKFATCDVQSSIYNINVNNNNNLKNINVKEIITEFKFDLLLFSYVLVENAISVKQNNFIFVKETLSLASKVKHEEFEESTDGSHDTSVYNLCLDSTHRLYPDIITEILKSNQTAFFVPKIKRSRGLPRNVLLILYPSSYRFNTTDTNCNEAELNAKYGFLSRLDFDNDETIKRFIIDQKAQETWRLTREDRYY